MAKALTRRGHTNALVQLPAFAAGASCGAAMIPIGRAGCRVAAANPEAREDHHSCTGRLLATPLPPSEEVGAGKEDLTRG